MIASGYEASEVIKAVVPIGMSFRRVFCVCGHSEIKYNLI